MKVQKFAMVLALAAGVLFPQFANAAGGGATPEATFNNFTNAMKKSDFKTGYSQMSPATQDMMLASMAAQISMGIAMDPSKGAEIQKVMDKHGVKKLDPTKLQPGADPKPLVMATISDVKDKPACFAEIMASMEKDAPENKKAANLDDYNNASLVDVKVEGDSASGTIKVKHTDGKESSNPVNFKKIGSAWFIDMSGAAPAQKPAAPAAGAK